MTAPPHRGPFVGRDDELAEVRGAIADARAGSGSLLLVSGPAGIGKTRLVEVATAAPPDGALVLWGRAVDDPGAPPLWPWRRVIRALPGVAEATSAALAEVDLGAERSADPEVARFRLVAGATEALLAAAEPAGLTVVLEDLHWADETSLRMLRHLAGEVSRSRLLVVGTHRDAEAVEVLEGPGARRLVLRPLAEAAVRRYLSSVVPGPVPDEAVRRVHRRSGGNPLYLRALARRLPEGPGDDESAADGGDELRQLVRTTVGALDPAVRDLVAMAATLGEEVDTPVLATVAGLSPDEVTERLDRAVRAGVLTGVPDAPGRRRFVHAVVRDGIYADLPPGVREALHRRAAEALERMPARDAGAAGLVAGHWLRAAADAAALRRAVDWARRAAADAVRSAALDEAARFLAMADRALRRAGGPPAETATLLVELAVAEYRAGRFTHAVEHAEEAAGLAAASGRPDLVAEAALAVHDIASPDLPPRLARLAERALAAVDRAEDPALTSRLLAQLSASVAEDAQHTRAVELSLAALALAEASGDPLALVDAVRARVKSAPEGLDPAELLRLGRIAVDHGHGTGQPLVTLWGHKWRIDAALELGTIAAVDGELARVSALAVATRLPLVRWHDLRLAASVAALRGRFADGLALNDRARELAETQLAQDRSAVGMSDAFLTQLGLVTGETSGLDDGVAASLAAAPTSPIVRVTRALLPLMLGRREEAAAQYEELRPLVREPGFATMVHGVPIDLVPLVEEFRDRETAQFLREVIGARPFASGGAGIFCSEPSDLYLGRLALVLELPDEAVGHLDRAIGVAARMGARPAVVLARVGLARALLARGAPGDPSRAHILARQALEEAGRLGMPGPAGAATALLASARAEAVSQDPLSRREREVAELVAAALTNRQIADRLVLSERTVESHVRNILGKLGLVNRTEIATSRVRTRD